MANTPQSKKRARQNERRYEVNKARRSRIRTYLRKVEEAIAKGDASLAAAALRDAQPELMRGVDQGRSADASDSALKKNCVKREVLLRGGRDSR
ncbi:MAG: 30S ribosomal protein S20 [Rhodobacteraceae bacterium]|nr:30S ribosomal protein S20 [Paracoccaceae bacterium]